MNKTSLCFAFLIFGFLLACTPPSNDSFIEENLVEELPEEREVLDEEENILEVEPEGEVEPIDEVEPLGEVEPKDELF